MIFDVTKYQRWFSTIFGLMIELHAFSCWNQLDYKVGRFINNFPGRFCLPLTSVSLTWKKVLKPMNTTTADRQYFSLGVFFFFFLRPLYWLNDFDGFSLLFIYPTITFRSLLLFFFLWYFFINSVPPPLSAFLSTFPSIIVVIDNHVSHFT